MREVVSKTGAHFRISAIDPTVLEIQRGHGHRWRTFKECSTAEQAREWLAILGDHREPQPDMTQETEANGELPKQVD